jgi:hypothetical protein
MNFFIAVFFVSLGVQMEFQAAAAQWLPAVVLSLFVLIGNPLIFLLIITRMGYRRETAFLTSVTVAQISEFSFVLAALGLSTGVIGEEILSLIAVVGLVTIAVSAYMILYNHQLFRLARPDPRPPLLPPCGRDDATGRTRKEVEVPGRDHVIIVGMNALGRRLARSSMTAGVQVLAIDTDPGSSRDSPAHPPGTPSTSRCSKRRGSSGPASDLGPSHRGCEPTPGPSGPGCRGGGGDPRR